MVENTIFAPLTLMWNFIVAIILAVYAVIHDILGINLEGFVPNSFVSHLSMYGAIDLPPVGSGNGGDDRFKKFHPYLKQTEYSSYEQRDNHGWPTSNEMAGAMEQSLNKGPVISSYLTKVVPVKLNASRF
jgi:hypothetical protein